MDRNQAKEFYPILQAFIDGKELEVYSPSKDTWVDIRNKDEIYFGNNYRIKPETKYRPFANAEECLAEMQKHQPFGWVKTKDKGIRLCIIGLNQKSAFTQVGHKYDEALDEFVFADGTPFGVKVEE